jgi:hypothetical protein
LFVRLPAGSQMMTPNVKYHIIIQPDAYLQMFQMLPIANIFMQPDDNIKG